jgi:hypothetical protein
LQGKIFITILKKKEKMPKLLLIIRKKMLNFVVFAESKISSLGDITLLVSWPKETANSHCNVISHVLGGRPLSAKSFVLGGRPFLKHAERKKV